ncbi:hypothetical protein [Salinarimonas chemoclinalis]|uniref:hypothetical protein n=1 Tax=Salinarimonas chemoclinalis TaxID=3241599 RepID=UPI0035570AC5
MTNRILLVALAGACAALAPIASPAAAQGPAPLPLRSPSERVVEGTNRDLLLQRRLGEVERQRSFEEGQLRQRIDRLERFPRLAPPPAPPPGGAIGR